MGKPPFYRPPGSDRWNMCLRKKRYATAAEAQKANLSHRPYQCPHCNMWHLTAKKG